MPTLLFANTTSPFMWHGQVSGTTLCQHPSCQHYFVPSTLRANTTSPFIWHDQISDHRPWHICQATRPNTFRNGCSMRDTALAPMRRSLSLAKRAAYVHHNMKRIWHRCFLKTDMAPMFFLKRIWHRCFSIARSANLFSKRHSCSYSSRQVACLRTMSPHMSPHMPANMPGHMPATMSVRMPWTHACTHVYIHLYTHA